MGKHAKKGTRTWWIKRLDKKFSKLIRDKDFCEAADVSTCGGKLQHAHVLPKKTYPNLRFDIMNALCLCYKHHIFWAHRSPLEFTWWFQEKYPHRYDYLIKVNSRIKIFTFQDFENIEKAIDKQNLQKLIMYLLDFK